MAAKKTMNRRRSGQSVERAKPARRRAPARAAAAKPVVVPTAIVRTSRPAMPWVSFDGRTVLIAAVAVLIFTTLIMARQRSVAYTQTARTAELLDQALDDTLAYPRSSASDETRPSRESSAKPSQEADKKSPAAMSVPGPVAARPAPLTASESPLVRTAAYTAPTVETAAASKPVLEPAAPEATPEPAAALRAVTVAGCLARDNDSFMLKNVSGDGAPKSRSWKSGFLKKKSNSIELIDDAKISRLGSYVGKRVEATGVLDEREMHVKALRVQGDCD